MYKWIGAVVVLLLILGSLMTSGLVTALLDLTAFLVLLALVWIRAVKSSDKKQNNESDNGNESTPVFKAD
jgi:flagellar motor component MotA